MFRLDICGFMGDQDVLLLVVQPEARLGLGGQGAAVEEDARVGRNDGGAARDGLRMGGAGREPAHRALLHQLLGRPSAADAAGSDPSSNSHQFTIIMMVMMIILIIININIINIISLF